MLPLKNNPVLTDYQIKILETFFSSPLGEQFFLTGGTALSAFYFAHRHSKDFDLFTLKDYDSLLLYKTLESIAKITHSKLSTKIKTITYNEVYLENKQKSWIQRVDVVKDQPVHFGEIEKVNKINIDSIINIATNKITAIYGRFEPKDYIDLYFICKQANYDFFRLFEQSKKKDAGLNEFYFANIIAEIENLKELPKMLKPLNKQDLIKFYLDFSKKLLKKIEPKE